MQKPSRETIKKYVAKLESVAKKHGGKLPNYSWLRDHGLFHAYEVMRSAPSAFRHIKRAFARKRASK